MKNRFPYVLLLLVVFCSCSGTNTKNEHANRSTAEIARSETGIVMEHVNCISKPGSSYAMYLPDIAKSGSSIPVLFCFDSKGSGKTPIQKYKSLADKYGIALAASNNSKNGLPAEQSLAYGLDMMDDLKKRIHIREDQIYVSGFSGGARVASLVAKSTDATGLIACSAAPNVQDAGNRKLLYCGIAGNKDVNLSEMKNYHDFMISKNINDLFVVFDGTHEWPPEDAMEKGILWMQFRMMENSKIPKSDSMIQAYRSEVEERIAKFHAAKNLLDEWKEIKEAQSFLHGLIPLDKFSRMEEDLKKKPALSEESRREENMFKKEEVQKQQFIDMLRVAPFSQLTNSVDQLRKKSSDVYLYNMNQRLLGFMGLVVYSYASAAVKNGLQAQADRLVKFYLYLEPENPEANYLRAVLSAQNGKSDEAIQNLMKATTYGFDDMVRMDNEPAFNTIHSDPQFISFFKK